MLSLPFLKFNSPPIDFTLTDLLMFERKLEATHNEADPHERVSPTPF